MSADIFKDLDDIFEEVKDQEDLGYENLKDGEYLVEMQGAELTTSKSEKPMVVTAFKVTFGEYEGHIHKVFHVLTGATLDKTKGAVNRFANFAKSAGATTTGGIQGTVQSLDAQKGKTCKLTISTSASGWTSNTISL